MHPRLCKRPFLRSVLERQISLSDPWSCLCRRRAGGAAMLNDQSLHAKVCGTFVGTIVAPRDFEEDGPALATQRDSGAVPHQTIKHYVRCIEPCFPRHGMSYP